MKAVIWAWFDGKRNRMIAWNRLPCHFGDRFFLRFFHVYGLCLLSLRLSAYVSRDHHPSRDVAVPIFHVSPVQISMPCIAKREKEERRRGGEEVVRKEEEDCVPSKFVKRQRLVFFDHIHHIHFLPVLSKTRGETGLSHRHDFLSLSFSFLGSKPSAVRQTDRLLSSRSSHFPPPRMVLHERKGGPGPSFYLSFFLSFLLPPETVVCEDRKNHDDSWTTSN